MKQIPLFLGLTGPKESGKDASASLLSMLGYSPTSFAASLRMEVQDYATRKLTPDELSNLDPNNGFYFRVRSGWLRCLNNPNAVWEKPTGSYIRALLQWWGTEFRRNQNPDYWIKSYDENLKVLHQVLGAKYNTNPSYQSPLPLPIEGSPFPIVISDVRYPNEAQYIRSQPNNQIWLVTRPTVQSSIDSHQSEQHYAKLGHDFHLVNDGTLYDLGQKIMNRILGEGKNQIEYLVSNGCL